MRGKTVSKQIKDYFGEFVVDIFSKTLLGLGSDD